MENYEPTGEDQISVKAHFAQQSWQAIVFFIVAIISGGFSLVKAESEQLTENEPSHLLKPGWKRFIQALQRNEFQIFISISFFFYVACCALCHKLNFTPLSTDTLGCELWQTFGLLIVMSALTVQVRVLAIDKVKHPIYFSFLLLLPGIALLFSVWMPLLALPGAFVIFKWRIFMQGRYQSQKADLPANELVKPITTSNFTHRAWQLLPYIY
jgi:hypothetical protein